MDAISGMQVSIMRTSASERPAKGWFKVLRPDMDYEDKAWRHSGLDSGGGVVRRFPNLSVVGSNHELFSSKFWTLLVAAWDRLRTCETFLVNRA